jgi:glycosyltransferase involved in cell wall biosynthesis
MFVVSIVITAHAEGPLLNSAMESALRNKKEAENSFPVNVVLYVFLDSATKETRNVAQSFPDVFNVIETGFGDLAKARNLAIEVVSRGYVAFLDGDDIFCDSWIRACIEKLVEDGRRDDELFVYHPEINFNFGVRSPKSELVFRQIGSDNPEFELTTLALRNHWSALAFAPKGVFEKVPYISNSIEDGYGFEDWTFNVQCLEGGIPHQIVPETAHFLREKSGKNSLRKKSAKSQLWHYPSKLWSKYYGK